ncbi:MAG: hypothetical protein AAGD32_16730 [Planctomycetota bacterium]
MVRVPFAAAFGAVALGVSASSVDVVYDVETRASTFGGVPFFTGNGYIGGMSLDNLDPSDPSFQSGFVIHNDVSNPQYGATRRTNVEVDLGRVRSFSTDPADVLDATFDFFIDDAVFGSRAAAERIVSSFKLELYTDTANGAITNEPDADGVNSDYDGGVIGSLDFIGREYTLEELNQEIPISQGFIDFVPPVDDPGATFELVGPGIVYEGVIGGSSIEYPSNYGDPAFDARGFLGFSVDVSNIVADLVDDTSVSHLGFRLLTEVDDIPYTSLDRAGFEPSLTVSVVPEPGVAMLGTGLVALAGLRRRRA